MEQTDIDEGLYSRQLYVLGHDAMRRMGEASVLICGMRGLGVEVAKNVILAGVGSVTIQDEGTTEWGDLSSQFYLKESDLGKNRAICSEKHLAQLNSHVRLSIHTETPNKDFLHKFQVVVLTDSSLEEQLSVAAFCHSNNIKFILADTKGLCGQLFCDFGENFLVKDADGDPPNVSMIAHVSKGNPGIVTCTDDQAAFSDGMHVVFSGVQGMTELNSYGPTEIKMIGHYSFSICDTSNFSEFEKGGVATEVKETKTLSFLPLDVALKKVMQGPDLLVFTDYGKVQKHQSLHLAFQALQEFQQKYNRLPKPRNQEDANLLLTMTKQLSEAAQFDKLDEDVVRKLSFTARGNLAPINAFIGGLAAQEVMKACSGKFTPLKQWLYFDALECLPEQEDCDRGLTEEACAPRDSRYDGQIAVFGSEFQEKLKKQRYFLVGAGAIGCELLKNFALIGLGAGEGGHITVTDMDSIERSNLNRQFLFRSEDIGRQKSEVAAEAVRKINPSINITSHQNRVCQESESIYTHQFYSSLDGVAAALDNVEARVYLDERCVRYQKAMLEGGTLGGKGSTLVVVPHLTESYGPAPSSGQKAFPLCTLKHFPHRIEHTLQWAREQFEGLFNQSPENVNQYLCDADFWARTVGRGEAEAVEVVEAVYRSLKDRPRGWQGCVAWARLQFESFYKNDIAQLLCCFPHDHVTSSDLPFWMGDKRCPHPLTFDPANTTHMDFIVASANLYGQIYGIEGSTDRADMIKVLEGVHVPPFQPKSSVTIAVVDEELKESREGRNDEDQAKLDELKQKLSSLQIAGQKCRMFPLEFEKDDDSNFHMDFIVAASNLRAENYDIPAADRHKSKLIAGRIIPAIATTTAATSGLMCLELYKLVQGHQQISSFRNSFLNLATSYYFLSQPLKDPGFTVAGKEYSLWDQILVQGRKEGQEEMTVEELLKYVKENYHLEITALFYGPAMLYPKDDDRLKQSRVSEVVQMVTKTEIPAHLQMLEIIPSFKEDEDCEKVPPVRYLFR
ncbi:ubiquitin-like modifier-activating enzyme 1 isoform X1 [Hemibagrus wyckioides]|uniref:ubiquitin-like modifier-activating enzyme 1 isoform X1 n=1 Tax=Hemibagrus wyckioides TaxID=337641 RepID=UPI00266C7920|nr:ubiquitin-like modifier-activating enzyme 1 isoform X1 [Hemibagrus wyckioides]